MLKKSLFLSILILFSFQTAYADREWLVSLEWSPLPEVYPGEPGFYVYKHFTKEVTDPVYPDQIVYKLDPTKFSDDITEICPFDPDNQQVCPYVSLVRFLPEVTPESLRSVYPNFTAQGNVQYCNQDYVVGFVRGIETFGAFACLPLFKTDSAGQKCFLPKKIINNFCQYDGCVAGCPADQKCSLRIIESSNPEAVGDDMLYFCENKTNRDPPDGDIVIDTTENSVKIHPYGNDTPVIITPPACPAECPKTQAQGCVMSGTRGCCATKAQSGSVSPAARVGVAKYCIYNTPVPVPQGKCLLTMPAIGSGASYFMKMPLANCVANIGNPGFPPVLPGGAPKPGDKCGGTPSQCQNRFCAVPMYIPIRPPGPAGSDGCPCQSRTGQICRQSGTGGGGGTGVCAGVNNGCTGGGSNCNCSSSGGGGCGCFSSGNGASGSGNMGSLSKEGLDALLAESSEKYGQIVGEGSNCEEITMPGAVEPSTGECKSTISAEEIRELLRKRREELAEESSAGPEGF